MGTDTEDGAGPERLIEQLYESAEPSSLIPLTVRLDHEPAITPQPSNAEQSSPQPWLDPP